MAKITKRDLENVLKKIEDLLIENKDFYEEQLPQEEYRVIMYVDGNVTLDGGMRSLINVGQLSTPQCVDGRTQLSCYQREGQAMLVHDIILEIERIDKGGQDVKS